MKRTIRPAQAASLSSRTESPSWAIPSPQATIIGLGRLLRQLDPTIDLVAPVSAAARALGCEFTDLAAKVWLSGGDAAAHQQALALGDPAKSPSKEKKPARKSCECGEYNRFDASDEGKEAEDVLDVFVALFETAVQSKAVAKVRSAWGSHLRKMRVKGFTWERIYDACASAHADGKHAPFCGDLAGYGVWRNLDVIRAEAQSIRPSQGGYYRIRAGGLSPDEIEEQARRKGVPVAEMVRTLLAAEAPRA